MGKSAWYVIAVLIAALGSTAWLVGTSVAAATWGNVTTTGAAVGVALMASAGFLGLALVAGYSLVRRRDFLGVVPAVLLLLVGWVWAMMLLATTG